ncbi:hypothetical protein FB567DRAFT_147004 [Paraphoma chrysanthemicola]|uniref:DUF3074 domain-containing protein n=1 Tax=Paraphoma chrysanthemicola TaxID=798071 RepID=A0A8K0VUD9_9PLEO|nr:hypothetical protein FB567DRAFT_147004 [Paraphoma chrysanthemicola]
MTPVPPSSAGPCKYCKRPLSGATRMYLDLQPLCIHELPPHGELARIHHKLDLNDNGTTLTLGGFLNSVLSETLAIQWDDMSWTHHGTYPPEGKGVKVTMPPPLSSSQQVPEISVPVDVDQRAKGTSSSAWLARRSLHCAKHVEYDELDTILAQDHCRREGDYDPSVFDANELLKWDTEDLKKALSVLNLDWNITNVQMAIFQMFHEMPKVMGKSFLQDRVFHVLVITAHSTYVLPEQDKSTTQRQSYTLQLPINFDSLRDVEAIKRASHIRPRSMIYEVKDQSAEGAGITERQNKHKGKSLTEGAYVSVERLRQAPDGSGNAEPMHRWDMMTKSDAKGISRLAPSSTKRKETLDAISKDVQYVLDHIGKQRWARNPADANE